MSFFEKIFNGTKKELSVVDYYDYERGALFDNFLLSDIDGWIISLKRPDGHYCAPFSVNIPDALKIDDNDFNDEKLKEYIDATVTKYVDNMSYSSNNLKDEDFKLYVIGCYSCYGLKLFKAIKLCKITFKGKLNVSKNQNEGGVKNEEKKETID